MSAKQKLNAIEAVISTNFIDSCISDDNFEVNDVLKEYDKGAIKNPKNFSSDNEYAWYIQTY